MSLIAETPAPPYYAVIFSSLRNADIEGYARTAARMMELATEQPGFLGVEAVREDLGITVSYWSDLQSIKQCTGWRSKWAWTNGTQAIKPASHWSSATMENSFLHLISC
jgi:heme-degrading monooxygenase HmoA